MEILNSTPFEYARFETLDAKDRRVVIGIVQGTFKFRDDARMSVSEYQEPINYNDEYFGEPLTSSLRLDSQLVPMRFGTDVTFDAISFAPGNQPCPKWSSSVQLGPIRKSIQVYGERFWQYGYWGWRLTSPLEASQVAVRYENAYGGAYAREKETVRFELNPIGKGFVDSTKLNVAQRIVAPQIEADDDPITNVGKHYKPVGLGPIPKHCLPRRLLCGTADSKWIESRWPLRPTDFDFAYYNAASPGLWLPQPLASDAYVSLQGLSPNGDQRTKLPGVRVLSFIKTRQMGISLKEMKLDSMHLTPHSETAILTWRVQVRADLEIETMQFLID